MTPEEDELRRALDARSGMPSPDFRTRLRHAFDAGRPRTNYTPAIALAAVVVISLATVGVLMASRNLNRNHLVASGARVTSPSPTATPSPVATRSTAQLSAPSAGVVWVLVDYGRLYVSTDQGGQWTQRPMPAQFGVKPSVSFIDDHEGWLLAPESPTSQCGTAPAAVWHTTDGAATWHQLTASGLSNAQCKEWITFVDSKQGFITAWDANHPPTIYHTMDGGLSWKGTTLADPADFKTQAGGFALRGEWVKRFGVTLYLEVWGQQGLGSPYPDVPNRQYIYTSTDGGATWHWLQKVQSRSVVMVTATRWVDLALPGQSMETVNGGQQFHQYSSDFNTDDPGSSRFLFADATVGYAEGNGLLQRTEDGGAHWVRIQTPGAQVAASPSPSPAFPIPMPTTAVLSAPSITVVWALVGGQYLFRSTDQGNTWQQRNWAPYQGGGGDPLISFVDDTTGWALFPGVPATSCTTQGAQVWRTTDGANSWQLVASAVYGQVSPNAFAFEQCKDQIAFADAQHGFLAAGDAITAPTIWRTADGGGTWSPSTLSEPRASAANGQGLRVTTIRSFGNTVLLSASDGSSGYIFRSTDGGASWTLVATAPSPATIDVSFLTPTHWLKIEAGFETNDAGQTWQSFTTDYSDAAGVASTFVFADDKVGYGTVRGGVHRTLDGGAHWEMIKTSWP